VAVATEAAAIHQRAAAAVALEQQVNAGLPQLSTSPLTWLHSSFLLVFLLRLLQCLLPQLTLLHFVADLQHRSWVPPVEVTWIAEQHSH
jgi:hypothetical protein